MLAADALFCPACGTARSRDTGGDPLMGAVVGDRFLILDRIGHGGSGTIYRGEHITLRRKVAIKVLHDELSRDDLAIERFRREATTVSAIDNEHIVEILDFGRTPDGRLYLAMEFLEGESLQDVLKRDRRLSIERAAEILLQLGEALIEAHAMGYVHRDLRPRNVYLATRRGRQNFVKLLDFGLAKLVEHGGGEMQQTNLGMTFGDPKYMSPEQARGEVLDRRADIYSLGCIAYEILVGEPPFTGSKVFDILTKHVDATPPTPRERRSDVPLWLDAIVARMLAKRPGDRFVTVFQLVEALRHGLSTGQVWKPTAVERPGEQPVMPGIKPALAAAELAGKAAQPARQAAETVRQGALSEDSSEDEDEDEEERDREAAGDDGERDWSDKTQPGIVARAPVKPSEHGKGEQRSAKADKAGSPQKEPQKEKAKAASKVAPTIKIVAGKPVVPEASEAVKEDGQSKAAPAPMPAPAAQAKAEKASEEAAEDKEAAEDSLSKTLYRPGPKGDGMEANAERRARAKVEKNQAEKPAAPSEEKAGRGDKNRRSASAPERGGAGRRNAEPEDSQSGLATAWFADGDRDKDEELDGEFRERLKQARATISPGDTGRIDDDLYYDPSRKPLVKVAAAVGGVIVLILLLAVLWPSGDKPEKTATAKAPATAASAVMAQITVDAAPPPPPDAAPEIDAAQAAAADAAVSQPVAEASAPPAVATKPTAGRPAGGAQTAGGTTTKPTGTTKPRPPSGGADEPIEPLPIDTGAGKPAATPENAKQAEFFAKLGQQALQSGNVGSAASNFKKALELDPKNFDAALGQGEIALRAGSYAAAIGHFKKASKLRPRSAQAHVLLGEAYLSAGKDSLAVSSFKLALKLDPDNARAQEGLKEASGRAAAPLQDPY